MPHVNEPKILIVEDQDAMRVNLCNKLERRQMRAYAAKNIAEARTLMEAHGTTFTVIVLDVCLEDPENPHTTGLDLALEWKKAYEQEMPHILVYSAFQKDHYINLAKKLGASSYLNKATNAQKDVIRHVRAITLANTLKSSCLENITDQADSRSSVLQVFFHNFLQSLFDSYLGLPYFALLSEAGRVKPLVESDEVPCSFWDLVTTRSFMAETPTYTLLDADFSNHPELKDHYHDSVVLPIYKDKDLCLYLGLCKKDGEIVEAPIPLAETITRHLKEKLHNRISDHLHHWSMQSERHRVQLETTEQTLIFISNELDKVLRTPEDLREMLTSLSEQLKEQARRTQILAGEIEKGESASELSNIHLHDLIEYSFKKARDLAQTHTVIEVEQNVPSVIGNQPDLEDAVHAIIHGIVTRGRNTPGHTLRVSSISEGHWARILFRDNGPKIPTAVAQRLFEPFGTSAEQSLFIPKLQLEIRHRGRLRPSRDQENCIELMLPLRAYQGARP